MTARASLAEWVETALGGCNAREQSELSSLIDALEHEARQGVLAKARLEITDRLRSRGLLEAAGFTTNDGPDFREVWLVACGDGLVFWEKAAALAWRDRFEESCDLRCPVFRCTPDGRREVVA